MFGAQGLPKRSFVRHQLYWLTGHSSLGARSCGKASMKG